MNKPSQPSIGLVGAGRMGANIVRHLHIDLQYPISAVFDIDQNVAKQVAEEVDTTVAPDLKSLSQASDVVITVVTNDAAMEQIYFNEDDNLLQNAKDTLFLNCATVSPAIHQRIEKAAEAAKASSLEAPMASSIPQAREGTLFLMVAGKKSVFESCEPLLKDMSSALHYTGPAGTAAQVKALVNMVMNINTAALAEGLGLAEALGLDLAMVKSIFSQTGANSRVLETDADDMIARDHEVFFSAAHAAKDSGIALDMAQEVNIPLPLARSTKKQYDLMVELGLGSLDKSGVSELTFKARRPVTAPND